MRLNLRWCSDGFEFTCWNGNVVRGAFMIDAHDREVIAWRMVVNACISGSDIRDMMLEAVEKRFGDCQAPHPVEVLTDNGAPYTAKDTRIFARQLGQRPCFTQVKSPQSNGPSETFVHTLKRDYVRVPPFTGCGNRARIDRWLVRGLQREPSALRAEMALAPRVHCRSKRNPLSVR